MRKLMVPLATAAAMSAWSALAMTKATNIELSQNPDSGLVTVRYTLKGDENVIVTPELLTNGVPLKASETCGFFGAMNKELSPTNEPYEAYWQPRTYWPNNEANVTCRLTCWSKATPPDYMAVELGIRGKRTFYPSAEAVPGGVGDIRYKTSVMLMRKIPAAGREFVLGTPMPGSSSGGDELGSSALTDMQPHNVIMTNDYYIGVYEVTYGQFQEALGIHPKYESVSAEPDPKYAVRAATGFQTTQCRFTIPAVDAEGHLPDYVRWPNSGHKVASGTYFEKMRDFTGIEFDFPTEAQWEYACRAGTHTALYTGENLLATDVSTNLDEIAWYKGNNALDPHNACREEGDNIPHEVGLLKPNGFGLYDMLGNAEEWVLDVVVGDSSNVAYTAIDAINGEEQIEPVGPESVLPEGEVESYSADRRGRRGGSVADDAGCIRAGMRRATSATWTKPYLGMRLACPAVIP